MAELIRADGKASKIMTELDVDKKLAGIGRGDGIPDAPADDKHYVRQNETWTKFESMNHQEVEDLVNDITTNVFNKWTNS